VTLRRVSGLVCVAAGGLLLARAAALRIEATAWQASQRPAPARAGRTTPRPRRGEAVARLRIPRLGIDTVVAEGTDPRTLSRGPGHMEGTGLPGEADNCIIAGHRDGVFARLRSIRAGDLVEFAGRVGTSRYRIVEVRVVDRDENRPLAPSRRPLLTLITCYLFDYVGLAPRRLVVRGELVEADRPSKGPLQGWDGIPSAPVRPASWSGVPPSPSGPRARAG
jgi:sortase A